MATSDIHGYIYPTNYLDHQDQNLGLAKLATIIKAKKEQHDVVLVENGDLIQGSPLTYYHAKYQSESDNPMVKVINHLQYDASVFGNHEFNYGLAYLQATIKQSNHPWLAANIVNQQGETIGDPYLVKYIDGVKVVVLGITTDYIPNWEKTQHIKGLQFRNPLETAKRWVRDLKQEERPDVMVVAYHGGFERDLATGEPTEELTGENRAYDICTQVAGIDVLVTGHQHRSLAEKQNGVAIVQPSHQGRGLADVQIDLVYENGKWQVVDTKPTLISIDDTVEADEQVLELSRKQEHTTQQWLDQPIGKIDGDMKITNPFQARLREHPFIEFINKVQMEAAGVDISNTSLFTNTIPGLSSHVTMREIIANYIYPNALTVLRLSGKDIKEALEQSATYFQLNQDGEIVVNPAFVEPKPQHYNYDMWEGIDYQLSISNPVGERVVQLNYHGKPVDQNQQFDVVMNHYRATGGGNYTMFQGKPVIKEISTDMPELITDYLFKRETIAPACNQNWKVIK